MAQTELGFPELEVGLIPGWGGMARASRIAGLANAIAWIARGRSVSAADARKQGLADDCVPVDRLLPAAIDWIRQERRSDQYRQDRQRWSGPVALAADEVAALVNAQTVRLQRHQPRDHNPAPWAALETLHAAAPLDLDAACRLEAEAAAQRCVCAVHAALRHDYRLRKRNRDHPGGQAPGVVPGEVGALAVIGTGIMGAGIAAASARQGIAVTMSDANPQALNHGWQQAVQEVCPAGGPSGRDGNSAALAALLRTADRDADIAGCDVVIEAVVENPDVKRQIYQRLEPWLAPHAILATNTSTIRIAHLAQVLTRPDRFCGMHFFNPVREMQLVEVIRGPRTSPQTLATAVALAKRLGKYAIVVQDSPGFLVNRLLGQYLNEAMDLVAEGVPLERIEATAKAFGMPIGPLQLYDMVGLDTAFYAGRILWEAFPARIKPSPILPALIKAGRLGLKSGLGFFSYRNRRQQPVDDPDAHRIISTYVKPGSAPREPAEIESRLILPMLLEATRLLEEQIVTDVRDIDLGLIYGIGFPKFRGGLLYWADTLGAAEIVARLQQLQYLGQRMLPTPLLQQMAAAGQRFYC